MWLKNNKYSFKDSYNIEIGITIAKEKKTREYCNKSKNKKKQR